MKDSNPPWLSGGHLIYVLVSIAFFITFLGLLISSQVKIGKLEAASDKNAPTTQQTTQPGFAYSGNDCSYTSKSIVDIATETQWFYTEITGNQAFVFESPRWSSFNPEFSTFDVVPYKGNSFYLRAKALRDLIYQTLNGTLSDMENLQVKVVLVDLSLYLDLTEIDWYFSVWGSYLDFNWYEDPILMSKEVFKIITGDPSTYQKEPDFGSKIISWLNNFAPKIARWQAYLQYSANLGKTFANISMQYIYGDFDGNPQYLDAFTLNYSALCPLLPSDSQSACLTAADKVKVELGKIRTYYEEPGTGYLAKCAQTRPNSAPGLLKVPDGPKAYEIWKNFHLAFPFSNEDVWKLGIQKSEEIKQGIIEASGQLDFDSATEVITNVTNSSLYFCGTSRSEVLSYYSNFFTLVKKHIVSQFGYFTRAQIDITITGGGGTYGIPGAYDSKRAMFISNGVYNIGLFRDPLCTPTGEYFWKNSLSTFLHEAIPGHLLQLPLSQEISCSFTEFPDPFATAPNSFLEGWALYTETLGFKLGYDKDTAPYGLYTDSTLRLGHYTVNMLRAARLVVDTSVHTNLSSVGVSQFSYDMAWQTLLSYGISEYSARQEAMRYATIPAQALTYMLGRVRIEEMRDYASKALGTLFDPREFHNVLLRFGGGDLDDIKLMVETFVAYKKNPSQNLKSLPYYSLIQNMFSPTLPSVGLP